MKSLVIYILPYHNYGDKVRIRQAGHVEGMGEMRTELFSTNMGGRS
jgi:hypothetical protein